MNKVYVVTHVHILPSGEEDLKFIGVYESLDDASRAIAKAEKLPGFCANLEGFTVQDYEVGKDHWVEGFVTWRPET